VDVDVDALHGKRDSWWDALVDDDMDALHVKRIS